MPEHKTTFNANPTQRAFIESRAEADLFASRKGEGKSAGLVWSIYFHSHHNPGATELVLRDTWENLQRTTLEEFLTWFPDGTYGQWVGTEKAWYWNPKRTGLTGKVFWMGAGASGDATKIASMPLGGVFIDEPAPAAAAGDGIGSLGIDKLVFDTAFGQLRQPGMKWYACKLATNNPDESHWTFTEFVRPGTPGDPKKVAGVNMPPMQESGFRCWQTREPENLANLPLGYYDRIADRFKGRQDLLRRFVEGKFGFQSAGKSVTPEWSDELHLAAGLQPVKGLPLKLGWDGGHNPTCIISQVTPLGDWLILDAFVGDGYGMYELIDTVVKTKLLERYDWVTGKPLQFLKHTGDPNLETGSEATTTQALSSAHKVILSELGGAWTPGPIDIAHRIDPLQAVLRKQRQGRGLVLVDRDNAQEVWFALRGGWHYRVSRGGVVGSIVKDKHSHPGDATGYLAAMLFPGGKVVSKKPTVEVQVGNYFNRAPGAQKGFLSNKGRAIQMPREGLVIGRNTQRQLPQKI